MSSFHVSDPCSFTSSAPMCAFGSQTQNTAPAGSPRTAMRPTSMTSIASEKTFAPSPFASSAAAFASFTVT
jgi:hypothetical protein